MCKNDTFGVKLRIYCFLIVDIIAFLLLQRLFPQFAGILYRNLEFFINFSVMLDFFYYLWYTINQYVSLIFGDATASTGIMNPEQQVVLSAT